MLYSGTTVRCRRTLAFGWAATIAFNSKKAPVSSVRNIGAWVRCLLLNLCAAGGGGRSTPTHHAWQGKKFDLKIGTSGKMRRFGPPYQVWRLETLAGLLELLGGASLNDTNILDCVVVYMIRYLKIRGQGSI